MRSTFIWLTSHYEFTTSVHKKTLKIITFSVHKLKHRFCNSIEQKGLGRSWQKFKWFVLIAILDNINFCINKIFSTLSKFNEASKKTFSLLLKSVVSTSKRKQSTMSPSQVNFFFSGSTMYIIHILWITAQLKSSSSFILSTRTIEQLMSEAYVKNSSPLFAFRFENMWNRVEKGILS